MKLLSHLLSHDLSKLYIVRKNSVSGTSELLNYYVILAHFVNVSIAWYNITSGTWSLKEGMKNVRVQQMSVFS